MALTQTFPYRKYTHVPYQSQQLFLNFGQHILGQDKEDVNLIYLLRYIDVLNQVIYHKKDYLVFCILLSYNRCGIRGYFLSLFSISVGDPQYLQSINKNISSFYQLLMNLRESFWKNDEK